MVVDVQPISGGSDYIIMIRSNIFVHQPCFNLLSATNQHGTWNYTTEQPSPNCRPEARPTGVPISATVSYRSWRPSRTRRSSRADTISRIPISVRASDSHSSFVCLLPMLSRPIYSGLSVPLEARKTCGYVYAGGFRLLLLLCLRWRKYPSGWRHTMMALMVHV